MKAENKKLDKGSLIAIGLILVIFLLAVMTSASAKTLLLQGVNTQEIYIPGLDGAKLRAVIYKPVKFNGRLPAVIVVHGLGGSSDTMNAISTELARNGVLVLALNYRGHDGSEGGVSYIGDPLTAPNISNDLIASLKYLSMRDDVDANRIGVVGYSMGSRAALRLGLLVSSVNPVVMIGPYFSWEIAGVNTTRPSNLLIIVGEKDIITPPSSAQLLFNYATQTQGKPFEVFGSPSKGTARKLVIVPNADHYTIIFAKQTVEETTSWVLTCFGMGKPSSYIDPTFLASTSASASLLAIIAILALVYLTGKYLRKIGVSKIPERPQGLGLIKSAVLLVVVTAYYMIASFFTIPILVDLGWRIYTFAMFSGAQYTIYYFALLALLLLPLVVVYAILRKSFIGEIRSSVKRNLKAGLITVGLIWLFMYILYNATLTGLVANYSMTPVRFILMFYLTLLLLPTVFIDETVLRGIIQDNVPSKMWPVRVAVAAIIQYLSRILPLAIWVSLSANPLQIEGLLRGYMALNLIAPQNMDIVKAFIPMNSYGLYYAFSSVELFHALVAPYLYEEYRSTLTTSLFRSLTVAFTMASVMALL